jgi:hypothetical protein
MARSDEAEAFFHAVYNAIQEIPHGKVTSYAHIARLIGTRKLDLLLPFQHAFNSLMNASVADEFPRDLC